MNTGVYLVSLHAGISPILSSFMAAIVAMGTNFLLNDEITWRSERSGMKRFRAMKYFATSLLRILINLIILISAVSELSMAPLWANWLGIGLASIVTYLMSNYWTWRSHESKKGAVV